MQHIVNFSGGKESTAMLLRMIELGMHIDDVMFCDNGLEYPEIYAYIDKIQDFIGFKITVIKPKKTFDQLFYTPFTKGRYVGQIRGFPFCCSRGCWISRDLKQRPMEYARPKDAIIYLGINYKEKNRVQHEVGRCENLRYPLIDWKWDADQCLKYLRSKDLFPPIYNRFKRTGCWLCPKQSIKSLEILYRDYPYLWFKLKQYEKDSPHGFRPDEKLSDLEKRFIDTGNY